MLFTIILRFTNRKQDFSYLAGVEFRGGGAANREPISRFCRTRDGALKFKCREDAEQFLLVLQRDLPTANLMEVYGEIRGPVK